MILSRQDIQTLTLTPPRRVPRAPARRLRRSRQRRRGLYSRGTGSEVSLCLRANEELTAKGIATRVVALPCWRCFDAQPSEYRRDVLRRSIPSVAIEAGATLGWAN